MEKLASRKLWVTIIAGAIVVIGDKFGIELDQQALYALAGTVMAYVLGQAQIDKTKVKAEIDTGVATLAANANAIIVSLQAELEALKAE